MLISRLMNTQFPGHPDWFTGYNNTVCDREGCNNTKATGTATTYCSACDALPTCPCCGEPVDDCDAAYVYQGDMDDYSCKGQIERNFEADREKYCANREARCMEQYFHGDMDAE